MDWQAVNERRGRQQACLRGGGAPGDGQPYIFVEKTISQYPDLDLDMVKEAFEEVKAEVLRLEEEGSKSKKGKKATEVSTEEN